MVEFDVKLERFRDKETGAFVSGQMFRNIFHAAAAIAKDVRRTVRNAPTPSAPGKPPRSRRGLLRRAIRYHVDPVKQSAVIGPRKSVIGGAASVHEFGGSYKGDSYPERPFMAPALERNLRRLGGSFSGSVGG